MELESILDSLKGAASLSERIERASRYFVGRPYLSNPLCGSSRTKEVYTASLDGFDCVTYVETVLAVALAKSPADFINALRRIRYNAGEVDWARRNHYMTGWVASNEDAGFIRNLTSELGAVARTRTLSVVEGLATEKVNFGCIPPEKFDAFKGRAETGDILLFVSPRRTLDVFHTGFLIIEGGRLFLRHASRTRGLVIEEPLSEFVNSHRLSGYILVRPQEI